MSNPTAPETDSSTPAVATPPAPTQEQHGDNSGREAAKYRTRLRETEQARDQLQERVQSMQRREVERLAATLAKPEALWAVGTKLEDLLDADGDVDPTKVHEVVEQATNSFGLAPAPRVPSPDSGQGPRPGSTGAAPISWQDALRGK